MEKQLTTGDVADQLLQGNWQILNRVLEDNLARTTREQAIRDIHFGWIYYAGYYHGTAGYQKIIDMVNKWDTHVGFEY